MYEPLVSIIIPIYNVSTYLRQCLDSVINQTYHNLEIILVDDGSTDNSGNICEEYAAKDLRFIVIHKENEGLSAARNTGLDRINGKYVVFVDSDDYIDKQFIEIFINIALKYRLQLVIGPSIKFMDGHHIPLGANHKIPGRQHIKKYSTREAILDMLYRRHLPMYSHGKLYDSALFQTIRFPKGKLYEDVVVTWNIVKQIDSLIYINLPLYFYRQRTGSIINTSFQPRKMDQIYAAKDIMEEVINDKELYTAALSKYFFCLADLYVQVDKKHMKEKKLLETELKKYAPIIKKDPKNDKALNILAAMGTIHVYFIRIIGKGYKCYNKLKWKNI